MVPMKTRLGLRFAPSGKLVGRYLDICIYFLTRHGNSFLLKSMGDGGPG